MSGVWWIIIGLAALAIGGSMTTIKINNVVATLPKGKGVYPKRALSTITGIGYHFVISPDGTIDQTNDLDTISYHVGGHYNTTNIGICLIGNLSKHPPTSQQKESLKFMITHLRGVVERKLSVRGHREFASTECPGKMMDLTDFR